MAGFIHIFFCCFIICFVLDGTTSAYAEPIYDLTQTGDVIPGKNIFFFFNPNYI